MIIVVVFLYNPGLITSSIYTASAKRIEKTTVFVYMINVTTAKYPHYIS